MTTPNFLILGAPKAGTTALYAYLSQHPQVYMSPHKEPNFFAFEGAPPRYTGPGDSSGINRSSVTRLDAYLALFAGANGEAAVGEASPLYLQFPDAAHRIHHHVPDAKLIAILRNPVERAYSDFLYRRKNGNEPSDDPLVAFQSEDERLARGWSPYFGYLQKGRYADHLERYFSLFSRDQITVFLFEDLRNEIDATLRRDLRVPRRRRCIPTGHAPALQHLRGATQRRCPARAQRRQEESQPQSGPSGPADGPHAPLVQRRTEPKPRPGPGDVRARARISAGRVRPADRASCIADRPRPLALALTKPGLRPRSARGAGGRRRRPRPPQSKEHLYDAGQGVVRAW